MISIKQNNQTSRRKTFLFLTAVVFLTFAFLLVITQVGYFGFYKGITGFVVSGPSQGDIDERGSYWNKLNHGSFSNSLFIYGSPVNYHDGSNFQSIDYGPYDTGFRDFNDTGFFAYSK